MTKYSKQQLNAISRYYSYKKLDEWHDIYYMLEDEEDKKIYRLLDKKYKYVECKRQAFIKYLKEKYGDEQARKIK